MKKTIFRFFPFVTRINKTHLQMVLALISLAMLVLGAGAPEDFSGGAR